jgi:hypothetical protein
MSYKFFIIFLLFSLPVFAEDDDRICPTNVKNIPATTPTYQFGEYSQFSDTVVDKKTGLMWARCPLGYSWDSSSCVSNGNQSSMTWTEALGFIDSNMSADDPYLAYSDWRMPNIKELASIVERKCAGFAMNHVIFGGTSGDIYWSNTHISDIKIRVVDFLTGQVTGAAATQEHYLRLVRNVTP